MIPVLFAIMRVFYAAECKNFFYSPHPCQQAKKKKKILLFSTALPRLKIAAAFIQHLLCAIEKPAIANVCTVI